MHEKESGRLQPSNVNFWFARRYIGCHLLRMRISVSPFPTLPLRLVVVKFTKKTFGFQQTAGVQEFTCSQHWQMQNLFSILFIPSTMKLWKQIPWRWAIAKHIETKALEVPNAFNIDDILHSASAVRKFCSIRINYVANALGKCQTWIQFKTGLNQLWNADDFQKQCISRNFHVQEAIRQRNHGSNKHVALQRTNSKKECWLFPRIPHSWKRNKHLEWNAGFAANGWLVFRPTT